MTPMHYALGSETFRGYHFYTDLFTATLFDAIILSYFPKAGQILHSFANGSPPLHHLRK